VRAIIETGNRVDRRSQLLDAMYVGSPRSHLPVRSLHDRSGLAARHPLPAMVRGDALAVRCGTWAVLLLLLLLALGSSAVLAQSQFPPSAALPATAAEPLPSTGFGEVASCSAYGTCGWCVSNSSCAYCALAGAGKQGEGLCVERDEQGKEQCASEPGSLVQTAEQCAQPGDVCEARVTCLACAAAPLALNCGWCAATGTCTSGTVQGPDSGISCGSGHSGWGFQSHSCTQQALCNQADRTNCTSCMEISAACGWCAATERCETGGPMQPTDLDCPKAHWFIKGCDLPAADRCDGYASCVDCENAPAVLNCGWCSSTGLCVPGDATEPTPPAQCPVDSGTGNSSWTFQSCPSDVICSWETDCADCTAHPFCVWCGDGGGSCVPGQQQPIPSATCSASGVISHWQKCPASSEGDPLPVAGRWALACMVVSSILFTAVLLAACGLSKWLTPVLGSRIGVSGLRVSDFTRGCRRILPLLLSVSVVCLKLPALAMDQWDAEYLTSGDKLFGSVLYGALTQRKHVDNITGGRNSAITYKDLCIKMEGEGQADSDVELCKMLRAAGGLTLAGGLLSALATCGCFLLLLGTTFCRGLSGGLSRHAVRLWRLSFVGWLSTAWVCLVWIGAGHVVIIHEEGMEQVELGVSCILFLAALAFELALTMFLRRAVTSTPDLTRGGGGGQPQSLLAGSAYRALSPPPHASSSGMARLPYRPSSSGAPYNNLPAHVDDRPLSEYSDSSTDVLPVLFAGSRGTGVSGSGSVRGAALLDEAAYLYPPPSSSESSINSTTSSQQQRHPDASAPMQRIDSALGVSIEGGYQPPRSMRDL